MAVGLSDLDGIRAARKIMQAKPVPVILVSSHYDTETVERAKQAGVMGYLLKLSETVSYYPRSNSPCLISKSLSLSKKKTRISRRPRGAQDHRARERDPDEKQGLSEPEAFSLIQKKSMDLRKPMGEIAQAVILSEELSKAKNE